MSTREQRVTYVLDIDGQLHVVENVPARINFQRADGVLVFRYDNVTHHPEITSSPHYMHVGDTVVACVPPDLSEVLREIDGILYG